MPHEKQKYCLVGSLAASSIFFVTSSAELPFVTLSSLVLLLTSSDATSLPFGSYMLRRMSNVRSDLDGVGVFANRSVAVYGFPGVIRKFGAGW